MLSEIDIDWIKDAKTVAVTAGASTPTPITKEVITFLEQFDPTDYQHGYKKIKFHLTKILPKVKKVCKIKHLDSVLYFLFTL